MKLKDRRNDPDNRNSRKVRSPGSWVSGGRLSDGGGGFKAEVVARSGGGRSGQ